MQAQSKALSYQMLVEKRRWNENDLDSLNPVTVQQSLTQRLTPQAEALLSLAKVQSKALGSGLVIAFSDKDAKSVTIQATLTKPEGVVKLTGTEIVNSDQGDLIALDCQCFTTGESGEELTIVAHCLS